ncbi:M48 family metalloprotease [Rhizobacter fulvus]
MHVLRALRFVCALALLCSFNARAQHWEVKSILANVQQPNVRLTATKNGNVETVDTVKREWVLRVATVTERLAPAYGLRAPDQYLVKQSGPNAFVTFYKDQPAMFVNTDMLRLAGDDDDMMAAVIGHELGHLKANHLTDGKNRAAVVSLLSTLAGLAVDIAQAKRGVDTGGLGTQVGSLGGQLVNAKFSRDQEREADDIGLRSMASVGYDPHAAPRLWARMEALSGGGSGLWLSSHPSSAERFQTLTVAAAKLPSASTTTYAKTDTTPAPYDPYPVSVYRTMALTSEELGALEPGPYRRGVVATKSGALVEAVEQYAIAAEQGDERAMAALGDAYSTGKGANQDFAVAIDYYKRSASKGFGPGLFALASMNLAGRGQAVDPTEAMTLYSSAEARGLPRATAMIGLMYAEGAGVPKDLVKARELTSRAASKGDMFGRAAYAAMLRDGVGGPTDVPKSFEILSSLGEENVGYAHFQLALSYDQGAGTAPDKNKAAEFYRKALASGLAPAKARLQALGFAE